MKKFLSMLGFVLMLMCVGSIYSNREQYAQKLIQAGIKQNSNGLYSISIVDYSLALILKPDSAWAYNSLGTSYYNIAKYESYSKQKAIKNYNLAINAYNKAIELAQGNYPSAYANRGNSYERLGNYKLAYDDYMKALERDPNNYTALYGLSMIYSSKDYKDYQKSVDILEKLIKWYPKYAPLYFDLGWNYDLLGQYDTSIIYYKKVLELNPQNVAAMINISYVYELKLKDYENALIYADKALALKPNSLYALSNKAYALIQLKRYDEAKIYVDRQFHINPDGSRAYFQRAQIKLAKGDKAGAKIDFNEALKHEEKSNSEDKDIIVNMINNFLKECYSD